MPRNRSVMTALNLTPDGKQPTNGFDLANFETSTCKGGAFQVVGVRETVPNSDYRMSVDAFTRTIPCNTANFAHMKENYYFIHVPLGLVNRNAYQVMVDRKQQYSALDFGIEQFPVFSLADVVYRCLEISQLDLSLPENAKFKDVHGFNIGNGAIRLLDQLGYGCFVDLLEALNAGAIPLGMVSLWNLKAVYGGRKVNANAIAAYQCAWYHFFRNDVYDNDVSARCFNFDDVTVKLNGSDQVNYDILQVRTIDDFIIECLQQRYVGYKKDLYTAFMPGTQFGPVSSVPIAVDFDNLTAQFVGLQGEAYGTGSFSGTSGTDINRHNFYDTTQSQIDATEIAYDSNEAPVLFPEHGDAYLNNSSLLVGTINQDENIDVGYYLKSVSSQLGGQYILDGHTHTFGGSVSVSSSFTPQGTVNLTGTTSGTSLFDVLQLVEAQAIQKWRQKSMLAGNKTADQFRAHHGVVPRHLIDHLPDFIGSVDNEIQVTEITSQADTATDPDSSNLGEIRGRGYGASNNRTFNFHCDDYGILLLIHAIVPENTYSSFGIMPIHTRVYYNDYYQSEFTNLGLQAIPKYNLDFMDYEIPGQSSGTGTDTFTTDVGIVGYAPRDYGYKEYPSKVHGLFNPSRLLLGDDQKHPWLPEVLSRFGYDDMQSFTLVRRDLVNDIMITSGGLFVPHTLIMTLSQLYVHPSLFDSIFDVAADDSQTSDEFINHARFICDSSLPMPVLGLPQF